MPDSRALPVRKSQSTAETSLGSTLLALSEVEWAARVFGFGDLPEHDQTAPRHQQTRFFMSNLVPLRLTARKMDRPLRGRC